MFETGMFSSLFVYDTFFMNSVLRKKLSVLHGCISPGKKCSCTDLKVFLAYNHNFHVPQKTEALQTFNLEETHLVHATLVLYTL